MTNSIDWAKAADLPPEDLTQLLEEDHDEVDDNLPATDEELAAMKPAGAFFTPEQLSALPKRKPGQRGPGKRPARDLLTVRVDPDVLAAWKASGPGWQVRLRDVLRERAPGFTKRRA